MSEGLTRIGDGAYTASETWCPSCGNPKDAPLAPCPRCGAMGFTPTRPSVREPQLRMRLLDRIRERELVHTTYEGTQARLGIGESYVLDGRAYRITRHKAIAGSRWGTIVVYGVRS